MNDYFQRVVYCFHIIIKAKGKKKQENLIETE